MRTTLTLDDDIAAKLEKRTRETGETFKAVVNQTLRLGLNAPRVARPRQPFVLEARPLGARPGVSLDNVGELLDRLEGV